ncbi:glycosyltransferase family 2 protein [Sphingomonas alpina]|uniref:Glycosyltransferase family 2 protein n=1 Tax=Sphingomonas alpina TaxID=653931 RepID=A0A7H0LGD3_9SPHN|nr:glycosyltransferase family 2 protein [Sphingomonas alpina]QNQ08736.1 glycosyltransferase family 2 protein [Sphingomonas alpina]
MTAPVVSVIMAAYNGAALVGETIASLQAQTLSDFEIVVVDDRSTDDTLAILRAIDDPRLRVIESAANQGPVRARNRAVAEARGRYIAGLDQDDLCRPERLARQVAYLEARPDTVLLGTAATALEDGRLSATGHAPASTPLLIEWLLRIENPLVWSSVMVRADAARQLAPFTRPAMLYAEDFDLYHRLAKLGRIARLDEELLVYRRHGGGASQCFVDTMRAHAALVLAKAYAELFGEEAQQVARLVVQHIMGQEPVPHRVALLQLGTALARLQEDFLSNRVVDAESLTLIRWETARRWSRVGRAALRTGTIGLGDAIAVRPDHLGLGHAGVEELIMSRLIGGARSAIRRAK